VQKKTKKNKKKEKQLFFFVSGKQGGRGNIKDYTLSKD